MTLSRRQFLGASAATASALFIPRFQICAAPRRRFAFLHTYEGTGRYWHGLEKAGLVREGVGVRLVQSPWGTEDRQFNQAARIDGPLHAFLQARKPYFIVDRVVGGSPYSPYVYDQALILHYAGLLGDRLMGGQVHEVGSNTHNDWGRLVKANAALATEPVTAESIAGAFSLDDASHWLEYGAEADYIGRRHPQSTEDWRREFERAMQHHGARFGGHYSYCEGSHWGELMWHAACRAGAPWCIAEVGPWASTNSQFAIASLRGAARALDKPWGVFYAPWGPDGCTSFIAAKDWSWQAPVDALDASGWPVGPEKGPSTALQRRIFFHAYLAGAHTLHEEWGAEGNLLDWDAGTLSSYGNVTKAFLDFIESCPDVGTPFTPIALLLPPARTSLDKGPWQALKEKLYAKSAADEQIAAREGSGAGEAPCYSNAHLPELFDIVPADAPESVLAEYAVRIDVESAGAGADAAYEQILSAAREHCPFTWQTTLQTQVNRRDDGTWVIGLYNPWGATRGDVYGEGSILDQGCAITETLQFKQSIRAAKVLYAWPPNCAIQVEEDTLRATVGPGGTMILEVT